MLFGYKRVIMFNVKEELYLKPELNMFERYLKIYINTFFSFFFGKNNITLETTRYAFLFTSNHDVLF